MSHDCCLSSASAVLYKLAQLIKGYLVLFILKTELYIVTWDTAFKFKFRNVYSSGFSVLERVTIIVPDAWDGWRDPSAAVSHPLECTRGLV